MFERNRVDSGVTHIVTQPADVELTDGTILTGKFVFNAARAFAEFLNGPAPFVEFDPYDGEKMLLAKAQIRSVRIVVVPAAPGLDNRARDAGAFDPYAVLGLAKPATWEDVRAAYVKLSKSYHPDRYSHVELPDEVRQYLEVTARRINLAYAALDKVRVEDKARAARASEPVFTSAPRS
ncbi:MAG: J domain-containing protein [Hyphomicrobium sp.]|nr:J domain-containing protein [Hyphomicrobium sp.]